MSDFTGLIFLVLVVVGLVLVFIFVRYRLRLKRSEAREILTVKVSIYKTGGYDVEFTPQRGTHPTDLIQLAISTYAWIFVLSRDLDTVFAQSLKELMAISAKSWDKYGGADSYRELITEAANNLPESFHADGSLAAKDSDDFVIHLIRGRADRNEVDHVLMEFSMVHYKPNLPNTALLVYDAVASSLDSNHLQVLHVALTRAAGFSFATGGFNRETAHPAAYAAVDLAIQDCSKIVAHNPERVKRHSR